jgi:hypothetical protein
MHLACSRAQATRELCNHHNKTHSARPTRSGRHVLSAVEKRALVCAALQCLDCL